jgi:hypothetical protein
LDVILSITACHGESPCLRGVFHRILIHLFTYRVVCD